MNLSKQLLAIVCTFMLIGLTNAYAQKTQWTYSMKEDGVIYKLHFQQERGTLTIQVYDSESNRWVFGTMLAQKPSSGDSGYYKIDASGHVYHIWTYSSSNSLIVKMDSDNTQWTYRLESSK